jgi:hypothetical protein
VIEDLRIEPIMTSIITLYAVAVFAGVVVVVLALIHTLFEPRATKVAEGESLVTTTEPSRRDQSAIPPEIAAGPTFS